MPEETLKNEQVDAVCTGEGEETILELVNNNFSFEGVKGIWYKKKGVVVKNLPREPIEDLDKLPFPERDSFDMDKYMEYWFQLDSVAGNLRGVNILASRGCPYKCSYCQPTLETLFGKKLRKRSPKNIVDELEYLKEKYNINAFIFDDDTFIIDKGWVSEICSLMISRKLDLIWGCNARANLVTEELFRKMKEAGLRCVFIGVESGSQRVLDEVYNKGITLEQVESSATILKKLKLNVMGYFMLGAPTETKEEMNQTIRFASKLPIDEATFSITTPLPKTYLYDKTKDLIKKDVEEFDYYKTSVYGKDLSFMKRKALLSFYLSPKRIFSTIKLFITPSLFRKSMTKLKRF